MTLEQQTGDSDPVLTADFTYGAGLGALQCPVCHQWTGLHIDTVEVHSAGGRRVILSAEGEDDAASFAMTIDGASTDAGRRHRIELQSWCEHCSSRVAVSFRQHKGVTEVKLTELDPLAS